MQFFLVSLRYYCFTQSASVSHLSPSVALPGSTQIVTISGAFLPNISTDVNGVLVSSSCLGPLAGSVATNTFLSSSAIIAAITTSVAVSSGNYVACTRWSPSSPYFSIGAFTIMSISSWTPTIIPASSTVQTIALNGVYMPDLSSDGQAYVLSAMCNSMPASAVTSISSLFSNSTSITLLINDAGTVAGVYSLCMRLSPTSSYLATPVNITIGTCPLSSSLSTHICVRILF